MVEPMSEANLRFTLGMWIEVGIERERRSGATCASSPRARQQLLQRRGASHAPKLCGGESVGNVSVCQGVDKSLFSLTIPLLNSGSSSRAAFNQVQRVAVRNPYTALTALCNCHTRAVDRRCALRRTAYTHVLSLHIQYSCNQYCSTVSTSI